MIIPLIYVYCFVAAWALPRTGYETVLEILYVDPKFDVLPKYLTPRIINGQKAAPHSIPYQVHLSILSIGIGGWTCSGSLISPRHVLTTAHCLVDGAEAMVHLGVHNIGQSEPNRFLVYSKNLIPHEEYDSETVSNDIGIIILNEAIELNEYTDVVALPSRNSTTDYEGVNARFSGWGIISPEGDQTSVLLEANATVISNNECRQVYSNVVDSHMCTLGTHGEAICDGDNGGPLVADNVQIGIISFGSRGCRPELPSGHTRITSYLGWLEKNTGLTF